MMMMKLQMSRMAQPLNVPKAEMAGWKSMAKPKRTAGVIFNEIQYEEMASQYNLAIM